MFLEKTWMSCGAVLVGAVFALGCETAGMDTPDGAVQTADASDAGAPVIPGDAEPGCERRSGFLDADGDGYGDPTAPTTWCGARPDGVADNGEDCDDTSPTCRPLADERCDGIDNDCDGVADEDVVDATFYADADGDGFGDPARTVVDCDVPEGYVDTAGDCDDRLPAIFPGAGETCDLVDQDCDGAVDEGTLALSPTPTMLGEYDEVGRNLALAADGAGAAAVWVRPGGELVMQRLDATGALEGSPAVIGAAPVSGDAIPRIALGESGGERHAYVLWKADDGLRARAMRLDGASSPTAARIDVDTLSRPTDLVVVGGAPYALWQRGQRHYLRALSAADAAPVSQEALIYESRATDITESGAHAVAFGSDRILFGVLDQDVVTTTRYAYVYSVRLEPTLEVGARGGRFTLPGDVAPRSIHLAVDPDGDPTRRSALAFVGWGERPDRFTQAFRFVPAAPSATSAIRPVGAPVEGLVIGASLSEAGAEWCALEEEPADRETLRLRHQPFADVASSSVGSTGPLMPTLWGASAPRHGQTGFVLFGGRVSPTDVEPQVWANTYGCLP